MTEESSSAQRERLGQVFRSLRTLSPYFRAATFTGFLLLYFTYDAPLRSEASGERLGARGPELPLGLWAVGVIIFAGLVFELGYGALRLSVDTRSFATRTARFTAYVRCGWRLSALALIGYHLSHEWWQLATHGLYLEDVNGQLSRELSSVTSLGLPLLALGYLLGFASVCFHLVDALSAVWLRVPEARNSWVPLAAKLVIRALAVSLFIAAANSVLDFATGASLLDHLRPDW